MLFIGRNKAWDRAKKASIDEMTHSLRCVYVVPSAWTWAISSQPTPFYHSCFFFTFNTHADICSNILKDNIFVVVLPSYFDDGPVLCNPIHNYHYSSFLQMYKKYVCANGYGFGIKMVPIIEIGISWFCEAQEISQNKRKHIILKQWR